MWDQKPIPRPVLPFHLTWKFSYALRNQPPADWAPLLGRDPERSVLSLGAGLCVDLFRTLQLHPDISAFNAVLCDYDEVVVCRNLLLILLVSKNSPSPNEELLRHCWEFLFNVFIPETTAIYLQTLCVELISLLEGAAGVVQIGAIPVHILGTESLLPVLRWWSSTKLNTNQVKTERTTFCLSKIPVTLRSNRYFSDGFIEPPSGKVDRTEVNITFLGLDVVYRLHQTCEPVWTLPDLKKEDASALKAAWRDFRSLFKPHPILQQCRLFWVHQDLFSFCSLLSGRLLPGFPSHYNLIDTSNLTDWFGLPRILLATAPLLKPSGTIEFTPIQQTFGRTESAVAILLNLQLADYNENDTKTVLGQGRKYAATFFNPPSPEGALDNVNFPQLGRDLSIIAQSGQVRLYDPAPEHLLASILVALGRRHSLSGPKMEAILTSLQNVLPKATGFLQFVLRPGPVKRLTVELKTALPMATEWLETRPLFPSISFEKQSRFFVESLSGSWLTLVCDVSANLTSVRFENATVPFAFDFAFENATVPFAVTEITAVCEFCWKLASSHCGACSAHYCSKECQRLSWPYHRPRCKKN